MGPRRWLVIRQGQRFYQQRFWKKVPHLSTRSTTLVGVWANSSQFRNCIALLGCLTMSKLSYSNLNEMGIDSHCLWHIARSLSTGVCNWQGLIVTAQQHAPLTHILIWQQASQFLPLKYFGSLLSETVDWYYKVYKHKCINTDSVKCLSIIHTQANHCRQSMHPLLGYKTSHITLYNAGDLTLYRVSLHVKHTGQLTSTLTTHSVGNCLYIVK